MIKGARFRCDSPKEVTGFELRIGGNAGSVLPDLRIMWPDCGLSTDGTLSLGFNQPPLMTWVAHDPAEAVGIKPTRA